MPAGSRPLNAGPHGSNLGRPSGLGQPASSNLNSGGGGGGVLTRNLSPDRSRGGGRKGSRGPTAAVGDAGGVEMVNGRGIGRGFEAFTPGSIGSSEAFDVEDANQRIAAPKVGALAKARHGGAAGLVPVLFLPCFFFCCRFVFAVFFSVLREIVEPKVGAHPRRGKVLASLVPPFLLPFPAAPFSVNHGAGGGCLNPCRGVQTPSPPPFFISACYARTP